MNIVFVPLAGYHTTFYLRIADRMKERGYSASFISFHEASNALIRNEGYEVLNPFDAAATDPLPGRAELEKAAAHYGIPHLSLLLSHEKEFYRTRNTRRLGGKLLSYLTAVDRGLAEVQRRSPAGVVVFQELGGFLSVAAVFYAARRLGIDNIFMEPSFFRGRAFFNINSYAAARVPPTAAAPSAEVTDYLASTIESRRIVIPLKDQAQYSSAASKILNRRNVRRLVEKTIEKHVGGKREEFSHIGVHVRKHARMLLNAQRLAPLCQPIPREDPFVYYPLHVPADVALTIRAPEYLDQYALIDYIARAVPVTHRVAIKEHPALIGALDVRRVRELLGNNDNVVLLDPLLNNHDVMRAASAVVTVNSKSGAEALMLGRPVIALGDSFYRDTSLVHAPHSLMELPDAIADVLAAAPPASADVAGFFQAVWERSLPGEMFDLDAGNCATFAASLDQFLGS